jgi:hypothetical protein
VNASADGRESRSLHAGGCYRGCNDHDGNLELNGYPSRIDPHETPGRRLSGQLDSIAAAVEDCATVAAGIKGANAIASAPHLLQRRAGPLR